MPNAIMMSVVAPLEPSPFVKDKLPYTDGTSLWPYPKHFPCNWAWMKLTHFSPVHYWFIHAKNKVFIHKVNEMMLLNWKVKLKVGKNIN